MSKVVVFSLTENGRSLGNRLLGHLDDAELRHRPDSFIRSAQQAFAHGSRCIFICSTGIVMRALAPMLRDKYTDPAVLVLDEHGQFVIPLLSGHEGGGCAFGRFIAENIGSQLIVTSATDYSHPVYCVGVGSDRNCPFETMLSLYQTIESVFENNLRPRLVASIDLKQDERAMIDLSAELSVKFVTFTAEQLRTVESQLSVRSDIVFHEVGCYGVAEAAALLGAAQLTGNKAELVVNKKKNARATIAVARSYL